MVIKAVICARYGSTRFPGKPLAKIGNNSMIQRVYFQACKAHQFDEVNVATDHHLIQEAIEAVGGTVIMTGPHASAFDRLASVAKSLDCDIICHVPCDDPLIDPCGIDFMISRMIEQSVPAITLRCPISSREMFNDPNIIKVIVDRNDNVLYLSRSPIPYHKPGAPIKAYQRIGGFAIKTKLMIDFPHMPRHDLEDIEELETLRFLESEIQIKALNYPYETVFVHYPDDIQKVENLIGGGLTTQTHVYGEYKLRARDLRGEH